MKKNPKFSHPNPEGMFLQVSSSRRSREICLIRINLFIFGLRSSLTNGPPLNCWRNVFWEFLIAFRLFSLSAGILAVRQPPGVPTAQKWDYFKRFFLENISKTLGKVENSSPILNKKRILILAMMIIILIIFYPTP